MPADTLERVQSVDGVEEAAGSVSGRRSRCSTARASRSSPTARRRSSLSGGPERFDPLDYIEGGPPESDDEVVHRQGHGRRVRLGRGRHGHGRGPPRRQEGLHGLRRRHGSATRDNLAGSRMVVMTLPEAQRVPATTATTTSRSRPPSGTSPEELKAAIAAELGPRLRRAHRQGAGREGRPGPVERARLHPHVAARVRRRGGARRRLPDLQHLRGDRRAALARVRAAAHARRLARARSCAR